MSQKLYRLKEGKLTRRDADGIYQDYKAGFVFVPAPNELKHEKYRLEEAGTVDDDSIDVEAAMQNTNWLDHPDAFRGVPKKAKGIPETDITKLKIEQVLELVKTAGATELDAIEKAELANQPRIRKVIIKTIAERREQLQDEKKQSAKS